MQRLGRLRISESYPIAMIVLLSTLALVGCQDFGLSKEQLQHIAEIKKDVSEHPALVNELDDRGESHLHIAVINNYESLISWLLDHGANINVRSRSGETPLGRAMIWDRTADVSVITMLLRSGADANSGDDYGNTPLHTAATFAALEAMKALLRNGASPNARARRGETPLHYAAREPFDPAKDHRGAARLLIDAGAEINSQDTNGATPLHGAAMAENAEMAAFLLSDGASPNPENNAGMTPLHVAAIFGQSAVGEVLLAKGANVNHRDKRGRTPLHAALHEPAIHYEQNQKSQVDTREVMDLLKRHGAVE